MEGDDDEAIYHTVRWPLQSNKRLMKDGDYDRLAWAVVKHLRRCGKTVVSSGTVLPRVDYGPGKKPLDGGGEKT